MRIEQGYVPVGIIRTVAPLLIETRHILALGDQVEYLGRSIEPATVTVSAMQTEDGTALSRANPGNRVILQTDPTLEHIETQSLLRKRIEPT
jgi:putative protease